jgi:ABC-2 type transport system ATP-binding protein
MSEANQAAAVSARGVVHRYGDRLALDGFDLDVPGGSVFGILGPNGSGKSTFLMLVAAMERPQEGDLRVFGQPPSAALRARVGAVFQENAQDPLMRVEEYLRLAAQLFGVPRAEARTRIGELLERFALADRRRDRIAELSGGMRRRVEAIRALVHDPDLLLLDEPTTGVDPDERAALWEGLGRGRRRTVLVATNDLAEAEQVCDTVAFVRSGRVLAEGAPADLRRGIGRESVRLLWPGVRQDQLATIAGLRGVGTVAFDGARVVVTVEDASPFVAEVFHIAPGEIRAVEIEPASLEDAYFQYIGRREREAMGAAG